MAEEGNYVELPFVTSTDDIEDQGLAVLEGKWPDWVADDGDLTVVMFEAGAPLAANAVRIAAQMPPAALIAFGTKLLELPYNEGTPATAEATFTVEAGEGSRVIEAGAEVDIEGVAFQLINDLTIGEGETTGTGEIQANDVGTFANGLAGDTFAGVTLPLFVTGLTLAAPTKNGQDQEDDTEYLNRVSLELRRRAKSIITLLDYEIVALEQEGIGGAWAIGLPTKPRNIIVFVKTPEGGKVSTPIKEALEDEYATTRMVNAIVSIADPLYDKIGVTWRGLALPGVEPTNVQASGNALLEAVLSPEVWGKPTSAQPGLSWVNNPTIHVNKLIQVLSSVAGLDYVESLTLSASNIAELDVALPAATNISELKVASLASSNLGTVSSPLSTGGAITSLPVKALGEAIPSGTNIHIVEGGFSDNFTTTAPANEGDTAIAIASHTPNHAYQPNTSHLEGASIAYANKIAVGAEVTLHDPTLTHEQTVKVTGESSPGVLTVTTFKTNAEYPVGSTISGAVVGDLTMPGIAALPEAGVMTGTVDTPVT